MQICFVDVSTLSVEDKDSKVGTLSALRLQWAGSCRRVISDSMRKGKVVTEGGKVR